MNRIVVGILKEDGENPHSPATVKYDSKGIIISRILGYLYLKELTRDGRCQEQALDV